YLHLIFSTKGRDPSLHDEDFRKRMHEYLGGIARNHGCQPAGIGGVQDHVHILASVSREVSVAELIRTLKSNSSSWAKETVPSFQWQAGYGAFSFAAETLQSLQTYVAGQAEHHRKVSFKDEFRRILAEHNLVWDEHHVWD